MDDKYSTLPERIKTIYDTCSKEEQRYLVDILKELADTGVSPTYDTLWLQDYNEIPVSIHTFLKDDIYLGRVTDNGKAIYPTWHTAMEEIFDIDNQYEECIFTGATRIGKTSTAITCLCYMLYKLMCLRDPQKFFNKKEVSKFSILFFNITKDLAKGVAFREFNDTLRGSQWFCERGTFSKSEKNFYYIPDGGKIVIDYGSSSSHALGLQVFACIMDELNFARAGVKDISKTKAHMMDLYNTVVARVQGTFRKQGEVYGKVFAVSSKKSDSDFIEEHIQQQMDAKNKHMYVVDKPQWEVLPDEMFSPERFYIAIGDRHKRGFVIPDKESHKENFDELESQGYKILEVPYDMKTNFDADFEISLRDLAGISIPGSLSFITQDSLTTCIGDRHNPFFNDIIETGTKDSYTIEEFFHMEVISNDLKKCPIFVHLDLSLNDDKTGIGATCVNGRKDITGADSNVKSMMTFAHLFSVSIKAPKGDKIPYSKILNFILWLRKSGFNIEGISRDQYQSEYMGQLLEAEGFEVSKISLDRTPDGYMALRSVLLEERIDLLDVDLLQTELINLQRDSITGKIDHKVGGSKDTSDCVAGSIWNAILKNPDTPVNRKHIAKAISNVNKRVIRNTNTPKGNLQTLFPDMYRR